MSRKDHLIRIIVLVGFILGGAIALMFITMGLAYAGGISIESIATGGLTTDQLHPNLLRAMLFAQHLFLFIIPAILSTYFISRSKTFSDLDMDRNPGISNLIIGTLIMLCAIPLVGLSAQANSVLDLPDWMIGMEDDAAKTLESILDMPTVFHLIANLIIISILPGIGEELVFRGVVQKNLGGLFRSPVIAIWLTALIFSFIHFQFEGFFPRAVLGIVLGYVYYWTKNLWVPIFAHAFNNGIQVLAVYFMDVDINEIDESSMEMIQWWMTLVALLLIYALHLRLKATPSNAE